MLQQLQQSANPQGPKQQDIVNLVPLINQCSLECLNQNDDHPITNAFFDSNVNSYVLSDCDPQLLIRLQFQQPVKLYAIEVVSTSKQAYPKNLKLFSNTTKVDFDECESSQGTQMFELSNNKQEQRLQLQQMKFDKLNSLTIFVQDNHGSENTQINFIRLIGQILGSTDLKNWKMIKG